MEKNYSIAEIHTLPSLGKIYETEIDAQVELRALNGREQLRLLSPNSENQFKVLADIIEDCMIVKPKVHVYDMAVGDYEYLLHKLRVVSYGPKYKMGVWCNSCKKFVESTADLDQLQIKEYDPETWDAAQHITLPDSSDLITIRFQTPRMLDEKEVKAKELRRRYKNANIDFNTFVVLKSCIVDINGNTKSDMELESYINNLSGRDVLYLVDSIDELNNLVGINTEMYVDCPECGGELKTFFRYGSEFFKPKVR